MTVFRLHGFGPEAVAYVRLELSKRETFWQALCDLPLETGTVTAYVPPTVSERDLMHFAWHLNHRQELESGNVDWEYRKMEEETIVKLLRELPSAVGVFRGGSVANRLHPPRNVPGTRLATLIHEYRNNYSQNVPSITEVYYILSCLNPIQIRESYNSVERMPLIGAIAVGQEGANIIPEDLTRSTVIRLAAGVEVILISAFGDDATLMWTKNRVA